MKTVVAGEELALCLARLGSERAVPPIFLDAEEMSNPSTPGFPDAQPRLISVPWSKLGVSNFFQLDNRCARVGNGL